MSLKKGALNICSKFTGEHPCQSVISIKLQNNFLEITLRHGCSPVNLQHIFRTPFTKNTSGRLVFYIRSGKSNQFQDLKILNSKSKSFHRTILAGCGNDSRQCQSVKPSICQSVNPLNFSFALTSQQLECIQKEKL